MQMDVHKTLTPQRKFPTKSTRSIRICFEIFFKWSCSLYKFATKVYFQSSAGLEKMEIAVGHQLKTIAPL